MAERGADVVITARDPAVGAKVAQELTARAGRTVRAMTLDLSDPSSTQAFAEQFLATTADLGVLINNAGVMLGRKAISTDGFEMTIRVNHLGHFHLTCLLRNHLVKSEPARVITVASAAHYSADRVELEPAGGLYRGFRTYARSKLANVLFGAELARRLAGTGVTSFSLHPGVVATRIAQDGDTMLAGLAWKLMSHRMLTPVQGAATTVYAATDPRLEQHDGSYLSSSQVTDPSALARDEELAARLWTLSEAAGGCRF